MQMVLFGLFFINMSLVSDLYAVPSNSATRAEAGPSQVLMGEVFSGGAELTPPLLRIILSNLRKGDLKSEDLSPLSLSSRQINEEVCAYRCEEPVEPICSDELEWEKLNRPEKVKRGFDRALRKVKNLKASVSLLNYMLGSNFSHLLDLRELTVLFSHAEGEKMNDPAVYASLFHNLPQSLREIVLSHDDSSYAKLIGWVQKKLPPSTKSVVLIFGCHDEYYDNADVENKSILHSDNLMDLTISWADLPGSIEEYTVVINSGATFSDRAAFRCFLERLHLLPRTLKTLRLGFWVKHLVAAANRKPQVIDHVELLEELVRSWGQFNQVFESLQELHLELSLSVKPRELVRFAESFHSLGLNSVKVVKLGFKDFDCEEGEEEDLIVFLHGLNTLPLCVKELHLDWWSNGTQKFRRNPNFLNEMGEIFRHGFLHSLTKIDLKINEINLSDVDFECLGQCLIYLSPDLEVLEVKILNRWSRNGALSPAGIVNFIAHSRKLPKNLRCVKFQLQSHEFEPWSLMKSSKWEVKGEDMMKALQEIPSSLDELEIVLIFRHKTVITKDNLQQKIYTYGLLGSDYLSL